MTESAVIVFLKNPELGKVKTRIAAVLGEEIALAVYLRLLARLRETISNLSEDIHIYYSGYIDSEDLWENESVVRHLQTGKDLGARMSDAFKNIFDMGYQRAILVGSDIWELEAKDIRNALDKLAYTDVVLGPASDGGYYLIGMNNYYPSIFKLDAWSHSKVFAETLELCQKENLTVSHIRILNDIDEVSDLEGTGII